MANRKGHGMTKHIGILVSPSGEEFYDAYGPMTRLRDRATRFATAEAAGRAASGRFGLHSDAFWDSERASRDRAQREYRGWTSRIEEVGDDDVKREGHYVARYRDGDDPSEYLHAHLDESGMLAWRPELEECALWSSRNAAMAIVAGLDRSNGQRYAISAY